MLPTHFDQERLRERFSREVAATNTIHSPYIVRVVDAGVEKGGLPYMLMELLQGRELAECYAPGHPIRPQEALRFIAQAAVALDETHAAGVVHRDLKPENIFLIDHGDRRDIKLLDFGLAKFVDAKTVTDGILGTPLYISPEQIHGQSKVTKASDIYALGMMGYTLLTGEAYWTPEHDGKDLYRFLMEVVEGPSQSPRARAAERGSGVLPLAFDDWFGTATANAPHDRFRHAGILAFGLSQALGIPWPDDVPTPSSMQGDQG
jgi:serine/threonine-protein kinase